MYLKIKFTDGTEQLEYCDEDRFRTKDGLLIISKGRYAPSLYINMDTVKSFQEVDRNGKELS
jgi:hypothetical protein